MTPPAGEAAQRPAVDVEARVQLGLTLAVGAVAACASWSHVLDLATLHGQAGWLAWAVAACIETGAVSAGLEVRRRRRAGLAAGFPLAVLLAATVLQLAAQIAQAERSPWGVVLAAVPAVTFLTLVKLAVSRSSASAAPAAVGETQPVPVDVVHASEIPVEAAVARADADEAPALLNPARRPLAERPEPTAEDDSAAVGELLLVGQAVAEDLARRGQRLNRRNLLAGIRARGHSCSSERASALLRALRAA